MLNRLCYLLMVLLVLNASRLSAREMSFRRHDDRSPVDIAEAEKNGIQRYTSQYLTLFTDIEPEQAREVVTLVDQVYPTWESFFGKLPPARDKSPFQITGYLMRDPTRFQKAGLLRINLERIQHGQSEGYEFWMHDQASDYYRSHLLLHEATHCYSTCYEFEGQQRPLWFIEGMAEYFGTHELLESPASPTPAIQFGIIPSSEEKSHGFGRIEMIRSDCQEGRSNTAEEILSWGVDVFSESRSTPYAWSWALCKFLASHPATEDEFRTVCHQTDSAKFQRFSSTLWKKHKVVIEADWELFRESLCYGFDLQRGATKRGEVTPLSPGASRELSIQAAGGWQSTGVKVTAGQSLQISAKGRVTLAETTKPWISEPNGIGIRYAEGKPIGRLLAAIELSTPAEHGPYRNWEFTEIGPQADWKIPESGVLYLRVNDRWNELADNSGEYQVTVTTRE